MTITVQDRLTASTEAAGGTPVLFSTEAWDTPDHPAAPNPMVGHFFGWHPPYIDECTGTKAIVEMSPGVIERTLQTLLEHEVEAYLAAIEFLIAESIANVAGGMNPDEALAAAEDALADTIAMATYNNHRLSILEAR